MDMPQYSLSTNLSDIPVSNDSDLRMSNLLQPSYTGDSFYWEPIQPVIKQHYFNYWGTVWEQESKVDKAFKLIQKLIKKKVMKEPKTVKDFIELVNMIAEDL